MLTLILAYGARGGAFAAMVCSIGACAFSAIVDVGRVLPKASASGGAGGAAAAAGAGPGDGGAAPICGSFLPLGTLAGGDTASQSRGVSADGTTVIGISLGGSVRPGGTPFRWTSATGMTPLAPLATNVTYAAATVVNADGSVIAGVRSDKPAVAGAEDQIHPFRWTSAQGIVDVPSLLPNPVVGSLQGISADGLTLAGTSTSKSPQATLFSQSYVWTQAAGATALATLDGYLFTGVEGLSADGSVVVGEANGKLTGATPAEGSSYGFQAYRWTALGGYTKLGFLPGDNLSIAYAVSGDGKVIYGISTTGANGAMTGPIRLFRWTQATGMIDTGVITNAEITGFPVVATNRDGSQFVALRSNGKGATEVVAWDTEHGPRTINAILTSLGVDPTGWEFTNATGISADGNVIVGQATYGTALPVAYRIQLNTCR